MRYLSIEYKNGLPSSSFPRPGFRSQASTALSIDSLLWRYRPVFSREYGSLHQRRSSQCPRHKRPPNSPKAQRSMRRILCRGGGLVSNPSAHPLPKTANSTITQDTRTRTRKAPEHLIRSRHPILPRFLHLHPPRSPRRLGRRNQARRREIPSRQNRSPQSGQPLFQHHDRVHGQRGRVFRTASRASVRRDQLRRAD